MDRSEGFAGEVHLSSGRGEAAGGLEGDGTHLHLDKPRIAGEAALDGIYVMRTSVPPERLSDLERALRSLKTIDLKDRAAKQTRDPVAPAKRSADCPHEGPGRRDASRIIRNECRAPGAGPDAPTVEIVTTPTPSSYCGIPLVGPAGHEPPLALPAIAPAGIRGLHATTEDRRIPLVMERGADRARVNAEVNPEAPALARIRDGCYRLLFTRSAELGAALADGGEPMSKADRIEASPKVMMRCLR